MIGARREMPVTHRGTAAATHTYKSTF